MPLYRSSPPAASGTGVLAAPADSDGKAGLRQPAAAPAKNVRRRMSVSPAFLPFLRHRTRPAGEGTAEYVDCGQAKQPIPAPERDVLSPRLRHRRGIGG